MFAAKGTPQSKRVSLSDALLFWSCIPANETMQYLTKFRKTSEEENSMSL